MSRRAEERIIAQASPARAQQSYRHEAFLWHSEEDYRTGLSTFISEGLSADEPVLAVVLPEHREWLADSLGDDTDRVEFVDMAQLGANPARIIPAWQQFLEAHGGRPVRGIGEPVWPGRRPAELAECQLHEALLNVAVDPRIPLWLVCPYDAERLDHQILEEANRSHPVIVESDSYLGSIHYGGRAHVDTLFAADLPQSSVQAITTTVTPATAERLEAYLRLESYVAGLPADKAAQLAEAAQRLTLAGFDRGAAEVTVRIWSEPDAVLCEVSDPTVDH